MQRREPVFPTVPFAVIGLILQAGSPPPKVDEALPRRVALRRDLLGKPVRQRGKHHVAFAAPDLVLRGADAVAHPGTPGKRRQGLAFKAHGANRRKRRAGMPPRAGGQAPAPA